MKWESKSFAKIDDITFSKYQCQNIPTGDKSSRECLDYTNLDALDRRKDQQPVTTLPDDRTLSKTSWYRISGLAGNQVSMACHKVHRYFRSRTDFAWIEGILPTVADGQVYRELCIHASNKQESLCCYERRGVVTRNCGRYFVYRFPYTWTFRFTVYTEYTAAFHVSFTSSEAIHLKVTGLNVWDKFLDEHRILYMSYNCMNYRGNMVFWEDYARNASLVISSNTPVIYYNRTSCIGKKVYH
ncbi:hypothetical protein AC249_AIPGENE13999 [Exaiptasia diaphana]|nr:hypothetical protein AC249_AIPGENE13999 [Exaiptasia diaphana]